MGGSSLAPEVICATAGKELVVLDSSDPDYVRAALQDKLDRTVVVVSSKSGSTVETDSQRRVYEGAFTDAGIDPTERIVIVTDPGSPLDKSAREAGYRVVNADPDVGGRYSALTAFGLVPSGLAGVDIEALLDDAESVADLLAADDDANPALRSARPSAARTRCATSSSSSTTAPASSGSPTGRSSSSPSRPARAAPACSPSSWPTTTTPRSRGRPHDVTVARLVSVDADDEPVSDDTDVVAVDATRSEVARQRLARRPDAAVGGRRRGGRAAARHQPVRPARRRERQGGGSRAARQGPRRGGGSRRHRRRDRDPHDGRRRDWLGDATTVAGALDALFAQLDPNRATSR